MRTPGARVSTSGRAPVSARKRSHTASFTRSVTKSRLFTGERIALTSTRIVRSTANRSGHGTRDAASYTSCSFAYGLSATRHRMRDAMRERRFAR